MFSWVFGLKGMAIAALVSAVAGLGGGWWARDKLCDAKEAEAKLAHEQALNKLLSDRLQTIIQVGIEHSVRAAAANAKLAELQAKIDAIPNNPATCGDDKTFDPLRNIR